MLVLSFLSPACEVIWLQPWVAGALERRKIKIEYCFKSFLFSPFVAELCSPSLTSLSATYGLDNLDKFLKISSRIPDRDIGERHLDS